MTLEEARAAGVCRICGGPALPPMLYEFGTEFSHLNCVTSEVLRSRLTAGGGIESAPYRETVEPELDHETTDADFCV